MVYIYITFTIQFPAGYWDRFIPAPTPVSQPEICNNSALRLHSTKLPAGWNHDPYAGEWTGLPEIEDFDSLLTDADRITVEELLLGATSGPKTTRVAQFYNLDTEKDWNDHMSKLDDEVGKNNTSSFVFC